VGDGEVNSSSVFALNALTGAKIWSFLGPVGTSFDWNNLLFSGTVVYAFSSFGQESSPLHSGVWALNASSGEIRWNYTAPAQFSSFATDGQNIYVCSNSTDYAGTVFALTANGTEKWHDPIKGSATSLIVDDGMVYAGCINGNVYAFDASDGKVSWRYSVGPSFNSDLYVDGYLYVGSSSGVYCLDAFNGALIWNTKINSATNPTYAYGIIYVGESGPMFFSPAIQHTFYALNAASGRILWSYTFPNVGFTCAVADGTVYIGADWVTHLSPDNIGPGRLFALKPSLTSLPLPPVTLWESTILAIRIAAVLAVIIILTVVFVPRKRLKTKPSSFKSYD
jgi:outer membrane protein assembly factor BamB